MSLRLLVELGPMLAAVLLAWLAPRLRVSIWAIPSRLLRLCAPSGRRAILNSAILTFVASAATYAVWTPAPRIHDEFSYLLAADTFAHGRLTNPTHPFWEHFETFHVIHTPSYQSKYPPAQGMLLAAGQAVTGHPIAGVWLGMAAGAAAVCWMLLAWMPPRWALFGALLPALRFGTIPVWDSHYFAYWSITFWGGAVAMAGGALLLGALPRIVNKPRVRDAVLMAVGLIVLANSRPYEGFVIAIPAALVLAGWLTLRRPPRRQAAQSVVLPAVAVLAVGVLAGAYYNYRITGDPAQLPYEVHREQYETVPMFVFQEIEDEKTYRHEALRDLYAGTMVRFYNRKVAGETFLLGFERYHYEAVFDYFWGFALAIPLLWLVPRPWKPWTLYSLALIVLVIFASSISSHTLHLEPHYLAPIAPCFIFLAAQGLRRVRATRIAGRRLGRPLAEAIVVLCAVSVVVASVPRKIQGAPYQTPLVTERPRIIEQLEVTEQKDLVIVQYGPDHDMMEEWVNNGAGLDNAAIVWARDMGQAKNHRLIDYYSGRKIWMLYADETPPRLVPHPASGLE